MVGAEDAASPRRRRRRNRPYNPRRYLEMEDYVASHLLTLPRSPPPAPGLIRRPLSPRSHVQELDRRQREQRREEERRAAHSTRQDFPANPPRGREASSLGREIGQRANPDAADTSLARRGNRDPSQSRQREPSRNRAKEPLRIETRGCCLGDWCRYPRIRY